MKYSKYSGLSLIELMVALAISSILAIGIVQIYSSSKTSFYAQNDSAALQESGRFVYSMLINDLRRTGYYGYNLSLENITGTEALTPNTNTCPNDNTWAQMLDRRIIGLNDTSAGYACITNYLRGDVLSLRYVEGSNQIAFPNANEYYLRSSFKSARVFVGTKNNDALNTIGDGSPESTGRLKAFAYYVGTSGRNCRFQDAAQNPIAIPTLFREALDATGTPVRQTVANGIEDIQFRYGVDTSGDQSVNRYIDADSISNDLNVTPNWNNVIAVRFWVLARADCPTADYNPGQTSYDMGGVNPAQYNDSFKRRVYTSTVALRN